MASSKIEWTEMTWNPVTGCTKVSTGCRNCYAEVMARRLKAMGVSKYKNGFEVSIHPSELKTPLSWKKPRVVFVNSMSDLFHKEVPDWFIVKVFETMKNCSQHIFQVLTKRPRRVAQLSKEVEWTDNIWLGVSVEDARRKFRVDYLERTPARVKFLSLEPLLGPLGKVRLNHVDWVIVGGESGPHSRPIQEKWILDIRDQCQEQGVSFFFKQWGGKNKKRSGRLLDGRTYDDMPARPTAA